jgi:RNA polymerase sigma factor (sigma-70 family)
MDDNGLLQEYVRSRSQEAFTELVDRHLGMVYSAACRMVRDPHLAQEITQNVFSTLAQKAESFASPPMVAGWLYNTTRNFAMHAVRTEQRRREREQAAIAMQSTEDDAGPVQINEHLESAMAQLESSDRNALVLRYLENHSLRLMGEELGISEDAARMRVNRALERLRAMFGKEGVAVSSVLLTATLGSSVATTIPAGLGAAVASTALAGTTTAILTQGTIMTMNWFNLKTACAILGAAALTGSGVYFVQQRQIDHLNARSENLLARQQKLTADHDAVLTAAKTRDDELERLRKDAAEVHRLRNEIAQLRRQGEASAALEAENQTLRRQLAGTASPAPAQPAGNDHGRYISKEQLAMVGYATPEAALQSMTWTMINGTYEMVNATLSPEMQAAGSKADARNRETFESGKKTIAPLFKGMQIVARKVLADDKVELKVKHDSDPIPGRPSELSPFRIQPMVKVGNEWKLGGSTRGYTAAWDSNGQIQTLAP